MTLLKGKHQFSRALLKELLRSFLVVLVAAILFVALDQEKGWLHFDEVAAGIFFWLVAVLVHLTVVLFGNQRLCLFPLSCLFLPLLGVFTVVVAHFVGNGAIILVGLFLMIVFTPVILRRLEKRLRPGVTLDRVALGAVGSFLLTCFVFRFVMGQRSYQWSNGHHLGSAGASVTTVFLWTFYWWRRHRPDAWLIFPVGAIVAAPIMLMFVVANNTISDFGGMARANLWDFIWAAFFGVVVSWALLLAKRYFVDKDRSALVEAVRLRGVLVLFHALFPVLIFIFLLTCFQAFFARSKSDALALQSNVQALAASAVRAGTAVGKFKDQQEAQITAAYSTLEAKITAQGPQARALLTALTDDLKQVPQGLRTVAGQAASTAKELIAEPIMAAVDNISLDIPTPFGDIELPDLGIGSAIGDFLGGLIPDINLEDMFSTLASQMKTQMEAEFAGPIMRLSQAKAMLTDTYAATKGIAAGVAQKMRVDFDEMKKVLVAERAVAYEHLKRTIHNIARLMYYAIILVASFVACVVMYLLWRMVTGLVVMVERLTRGWKMVTTGADPVFLEPQLTA